MKLIGSQTFDPALCEGDEPEPPSNDTNCTGLDCELPPDLGNTPPCLI